MNFSHELIPLNTLPFLNVADALGARLVCTTWCNVITARTSYWRQKKKELVDKLCKAQKITAIANASTFICKQYFTKHDASFLPFQQTVLLGRTSPKRFFQFLFSLTSDSILDHIIARYFKIEWGDIRMERTSTSKKSIWYSIIYYGLDYDRTSLLFDFNEENQNILVDFVGRIISLEDFFAPFEEWLLT